MASWGDRSQEYDDRDVDRRSDQGQGYEGGRGSRNDRGQAQSQNQGQGQFQGQGQGGPSGYGGGPGGYARNNRRPYNSGYDRRDRDSYDDRDDRDNRDNRDHYDRRDNRGGASRGSRDEGYNRGERRSSGYRAGGGRGGNQRNIEEGNNRETGLIETVKDSFGFIKCAERTGNLFFHFSDLDNNSSQVPRRGDEVSFVVVNDLDSGRSHAGRVDFLPKGTVAFEAVVQEKVKGVIVKELLGGSRQMQYSRYDRGNSSRRREAYGAKVRLLAEGEDEGSAVESALRGEEESSSPQTKGGDGNGNGGVGDGDGHGDADSAANGIVDADGNPPNTDDKDVYEFSERDVVEARIPLMLGDLVSFSVFVEKRTGRKGATQIVLVKCVPEGRQLGIVAAIRDSYGFIKAQDSDVREDIFFHFSEVATIDHSVREGDEVSFKIVESAGAKSSATRVMILPKGTVLMDELSPVVEGKVSKPLEYEKEDRNNRNRRNMTPNGFNGKVKYTPEDGPEEEYGFNSFDIKEFRRIRSKMILGDKVNFQILTKATTGNKRAVGVALLEHTKEGREQGVVTSVKESGYGFIDCVQRSKSLFFRFSDLVDVARRPSVGMELEFNVSEDPDGKPLAVRLNVLPKGTVQFWHTLPDMFKGLVIKELRRENNRNNRDNRRDVRRDKPKFLPGLVEILPENGESNDSSSVATTTEAEGDGEGGEGSEGEGGEGGEGDGRTKEGKGVIQSGKAKGKKREVLSLPHTDELVEDKTEQEAGEVVLHGE